MRIAEEHGRGVPHVGDPFAELLDDLWGGPRSWRQVRRPKGGRVHGRERDEHRREARGVDGKRRAGAERPDRQAGHGRADDARRVEHRRVEGDRVADVAAPDDLDHEALADGHVDRIGGAEEQRQDDDHPDLDDAGQREHGEDRGEDHHHGLHDEDRLALRQRVREHAAEQPEDHHGDELRGGDHAEPERIVGELEDEPGLGNLLHPGPDQRDELAAEEQLVVAVAEGAQPPDGVNGHRRRPALVALGGSLDAGQVVRQVAPARFGFVDHLGNPVRLVAERLDLTVDARQRVDEDLAALGGILGCPKPFAVALAGRLVLEQLADLGQREPGVVAQPADEPEPRDVGLVVQAVGALGTGGRFEEPDLLVVADGTGRQADLCGDLLDAQESGIVRRPRRGRRHPPILRKD